MTADERLERLLNRAGQTISDLPDHYDEYAHNLAAREATQWSGMISWRQYTDYILHLTDVIDRMEWALENVIGERDYLEKRLADVDCDCDICVYADVNEAEMPCYQCDIPPAEKHFEFAGIPEDWRADDGAESDT